jgi:tetratricopeptide (TPR) repeat protein
VGTEEPGESSVFIAGRDVNVSGGVAAGDHNVQVNYFWRPTAAGPLVVGDIPQEPPVFQSRGGLLAQLGSAGPRTARVHAVTGMRGVGKTQLVAAYARECVARGWRLVGWVNAEEMSGVLSCLSEVANRLGLAEPDDSAEAAATRVRSWLEADGERCLLVFDGVSDPDLVRRFLPAGGRSHVVLTGTSRSLGALGVPIPVDVFTEDEAQAYLAERTGLDDPAGASELARELGFLPLGLAQAAGLIRRERLTFGTYLERLRQVPLGDYLSREAGDPYPRQLAEAIVLSLAAVTESDTTRLSEALLNLTAVLSPDGVSRDLVYRAGRIGVLAGARGPDAIDDAVGRLVDASLLSISTEDQLVVHQLVARVVREQCAHARTLATVVSRACALLEHVTEDADRQSQPEAEALEAVAHITALSGFLKSDLPDDDQAGRRLLRLRGWTMHYLLDLGEHAALAVGIGEALADDSAWLLGEGAPDTIEARGDLARAYVSAGRPGAAVVLFERVLSDRERLLGPENPETLMTRSYLAVAYHDMGRTAEAASLFERAALDGERLLGPDHPDTLMARGNLALAYQGMGRFDAAASLLERVVSDRERVLGPNHPDVLTSRSNLALAYQSAGRPDEAVTLLQRTLVDRERLLGNEHPNTLTSRSNLALAYQQTGRTAEAIPLFERALIGLERVRGAEDELTVAVRRNLAAARKAVRGRPRVYVSHAHDTEQAVIASRLAAVLQTQDLEVIDVQEEIRPGESLAERLGDLIDSADVMLVLTPEHGIESDRVRQEIDYADSMRGGTAVIVPVFIGKMPLTRLPRVLARSQGIHLSSADSKRAYAAAAQLVAEAAALPKPTRTALPPISGTKDQLGAAELLEISDLVKAAFAAAGRQLQATGHPQLLEPGPVWISAETVPGPREFDRFSGQLTADSVGYFVHVGDLPRSTDKMLDQMRVGGKGVVTISERALRAALADGRAKFFLAELEQLYCGRDNLFDTKNALIDDRFFFGRDAILTTIGSAIRRDEHILISGLRKVGKTSLLNILRQQLADRPVCLVDLQVFDRHGEEWPIELFGLIVKAVDRWASIGRDDWPFTSASLPATASELARQLEARFDYLGGDPARQRVVVMLDEIERVFPKRGEADATRRWIQAAGALRALAQGGSRYVVLIGADLRPTANRANDLGNGETNPFFSFFQEIPVALLDQESTQELLRTLAHASGVDTVSASFIDTLFRLTGGHPSLARWIAAEAYRKRRDPTRMDLADLEAGLACLDDTDSVGSFIRSNLWEPMSPPEQAVATELSRRTRRWNAGRRQTPGKPSDAARASLKSQGIIDGKAIRMELLRRWIRIHAGT